MAEKTIGRLLVKVLPDLRGFYKDVKNTLEDVEKKLPDIEVGLVLDRDSVKKFKSDLKEITDAKPVVEVTVEVAKSEIAAINKKIKDGLDTPEVQVSLDLDNSDISRTNRQVKDGLKDFNAKVTLDLKDGDLNSIKREINRTLKDHSVEIGVDVNKAAMKRVRDKINRDFKDKGVDVAPVLTAEGRNKYISDMKRLMSDQSVLIAPKVDEKSAKSYRKRLNDLLRREDTYIKPTISPSDANNFSREMADLLRERGVDVPPKLEDKAAKQLKRDIDKLLDEKAFDIDGNVNGMQIRDSLRQAMKALGKPSVDIIADVTKTNEFQNLANFLHDESTRKLVEFDAEFEEFNRQAERAIEDSKKVIEFDPDTGRVTTADGFLKMYRTQHGVDFVPRTARIMAAIKKLQTEKIEIPVKFDSKQIVKGVTNITSAVSGLKFADTVLGPFRSLFENLATSTMPHMAAIKIGIVGLSGAMFAAAGAALTLGMDLATLGALVLPLPGIMTGVAIGFTVSASAFAEFGARLPEVTDKYKALKKTIMDNFWAVALDPIEKMSLHYLPTLEQSLGRVGTATGNWFGAFANAIVANLSLGEMRTMFDNLVQSIRIGQGAVDGLASLITNLGLIGTRYLPPLAQGFVDGVNAVDGFIQRNLNSGAVFDWINTGIMNLKTLGSIIASTAIILYNFASAARDAGGPSLVGLAEGLRQITAATSDPAFHNGLVNIFKASFEMMQNIATLAGPGIIEFFRNLGATANQVFPPMGRIIGLAFKTLLDIVNDPAFVKGFGIFIQGMLEGMTLLSQKGGELGGILGSLNTIMGAIALGGGAVLSAMFNALSMIITPLANTIAGTFLIGMTQMSETISMMTPLIPPIVAAFDGFLKSLLSLSQAALPTFRTILSQVMQVLPGLFAAFQQIVTVLAEWVAFISPVMIPVLKLLAWILGTTLVMILDGVGQAFKGALEVIKGVVYAIKGIFTGDMQLAMDSLHRIVMGALDLLIGALKVWSGVTIVGVFRTGFAKLLLMSKGFWGNILSSARGGIMPVVRSMWKFMTDLASKVSAGWPIVRSKFAAGWTAITQKFTSGGNQMLGIFGISMTGLTAKAQTGVSDLKTKFSNGFENMRQTVSAKTSAISTAFSNMKSKVIGYAITLNSSVKDKFSVGMLAAKTTVSTKLSEIKTSWSNAKTTAIQTVTQLWSSVKSKFSAGGNDVKSTVGEIPGKIKSVFSNAGSLLTEIGRNIVQGLINGIKSMGGNLTGSLGGIVDGAVSNVKNKLGIHSPSRVMMEIGGYTTEGLAIGISREALKVSRASSAISDIAASRMEFTAPAFSTGGAVGISRRDLLAARDAGTIDQSRTINYHNYGSGGMSAEEELFSAMERSRGW